MSRSDSDSANEQRPSAQGLRTDPPVDSSKPPLAQGMDDSQATEKGNLNSNAAGDSTSTPDAAKNLSKSDPDSANGKAKDKSTPDPSTQPVIDSKKPSLAQGMEDSKAADSAGQGTPDAGLNTQPVDDPSKPSLTQGMEDSKAADGAGQSTPDAAKDVAKSDLNSANEKEKDKSTTQPSTAQPIDLSGAPPVSSSDMKVRQISSSYKLYVG
ncbi:hypothetical protein R3P38DRAFT_3073296 [Favolaschia claudopus]|uniref:Uncharacterized protein n=1 Tax=Favolaschia claudopus TaxID=2862362 RepID=A0AAV9ZXT8_9AGAR